MYWDKSHKRTLPLGKEMGLQVKHERYETNRLSSIPRAT